MIAGIGSDPRHSLAPRLAASGERVGARGLLAIVQISAVTVGPLPLTRNPRAGAQIPTSPRTRGEVTGRVVGGGTWPTTAMPARHYGDRKSAFALWRDRNYRRQGI